MIIHPREYELIATNGFNLKSAILETKKENSEVNKPNNFQDVSKLLLIALLNTDVIECSDSNSAKTILEFSTE